MRWNTAIFSHPGMLDSFEIQNLRPQKNRVNPGLPYDFLNEQEYSHDHQLRSVNTIFLTNSECPFKCVMCDLWKNTLAEPVKQGDIPDQIRHALKQLPEATVIKLYNSGNFFDRKAIPPEDYPVIADLLKEYDHVIVENHPNLCGQECIAFRDMLEGTLEIAMGLETIHPDVLPKLNKMVTQENFASATKFLTDNGIRVRAFILLNPPFLTDTEENIEWTLKSVAFAGESGASACSIIPVRGGNGAMEKLRDEGHYIPPTLKALERAFEQAVELNDGRVYADLWDLEQFSGCEVCLSARKERMERMNLEQRVLPPISCNHCDT